MINSIKVYLLKYCIPFLALVVIAIHLFYVNKYNLNKWKGGGYGMYTNTHYAGYQIFIPGMSVDSLLKNNDDIKATFGCLLLMPNNENLKKAARLVIETTRKNHVHLQVWKPKVSSSIGTYTRILVNEIYLKN